MAQICRRCGSATDFKIFEQMHYACFHYEFEHGDVDVDEECNAGGCPSASITGGRDAVVETARELAFESASGAPWRNAELHEFLEAFATWLDDSAAPTRRTAPCGLSAMDGKLFETVSAPPRGTNDRVHMSAVSRPAYTPLTLAHPPTRLPATNTIGHKGPAEHRQPLGDCPRRGAKGPQIVASSVRQSRDGRLQHQRRSRCTAGTRPRGAHDSTVRTGRHIG